MYREYPSLMEQVVSWHAIKVIKRNKRAAGIDGMTVNEVEQHIKEILRPLRKKLIDRSYQPQLAQRIEISTSHKRMDELFWTRLDQRKRIMVTPTN